MNEGRIGVSSQCRTAHRNMRRRTPGHMVIITTAVLDALHSTDTYTTIAKTSDIFNRNMFSQNLDNLSL